MFYGPANVLLLIMLLGHVVDSNLPGAALALLGKNNYRQKENGHLSIHEYTTLLLNGRVLLSKSLPYVLNNIKAIS